jgi:ABC-type transport system involved in cytochrome c biogenesis permease component
VKRVALLLRKDALILRRSPLLLGVLLAYPLLIALLVGLVAGYASAKPRVALVDDDNLPRTVDIGGHSFDVQRTIDEVGRNVTLVRLSRDEARREFRSGKVVAVVTVPDGFLATLKAMVSSPKLEVETARGVISSRVDQQVQALVYQLNRQLQSAYIGANLGYVRLILHGGNGTFLGRQFDVLGLDRAESLLAPIGGRRAAELRHFVRDARLALAQTGNALNATAHPIEIRRVGGHGRTWALSADVQAYALGVTITFLALVLAAGSLAAERDENVLGRLARGLVTLGQLVWAKILLAAAIAVALGLGVALVFGVAIEIGNVSGGEPWGRIPVLALGLLLAGAALGAVGTLLGALAREARTASLVAVLVVLPIVFLGLVPKEIVPVAGWISDALPFTHAVRFFSAALFDASPWGPLLREALWLCGLGAIFGVLARIGTRRLLT